MNIFGVKQTACTCADLQAAADSYVAAQSTGDASKISLAKEAKSFENMETIEPANGLWNSELPIAYSKSFLDPARCKYVIGTRLSVADGKFLEHFGQVGGSTT